MTRGSTTKSKNAQERTCIATRKTAAKQDLLRFVVGPDGSVVPDVAGRLPGRGIYVSPDLKSLEAAIKKGLFARAAKGPANAGPELTDLVPDLLRDRLIHTISLARKAGQAVAGFEKVKSMLISGEAAALFQASDGSAAMKSKLRPPQGADSHAQCLTSADLGVAFGRDTVIHAALSKGGLTDKCLLDARRLRGFRPSRSAS